MANANFGFSDDTAVASHRKLPFGDVRHFGKHVAELTTESSVEFKGRAIYGSCPESNSLRSNTRPRKLVTTLSNVELPASAGAS